MQVYINIFGRQIPTYGLMIVIGILVANFIGAFIQKKNKRKFEDLLLIEAFCIAGGLTGAKILYIIVEWKDIDWNIAFSSIENFVQFLGAGFVFYGGLIGGLLTIFIADKIHKLDLGFYIYHYIFLIPLIHGFGRIGCFQAGCCYGIPYDGPLAVIFPEGSFAVHGVKLFPVQLVEAVFLMLIAIIVAVFTYAVKLKYNTELYLILYAVLRFFLEDYRYDPERGFYFGLSTSKWISIFMFTAAVVSIIIRSRIKPKDPSPKIAEVAVE